MCSRLAWTSRTRTARALSFQPLSPQAPLIALAYAPVRSLFPFVNSSNIRRSWRAVGMQFVKVNGKDVSTASIDELAVVLNEGGQDVTVVARYVPSARDVRLV